MLKILAALLIPSIVSFILFIYSPVIFKTVIFLTVLLFALFISFLCTALLYDKVCRNMLTPKSLNAIIFEQSKLRASYKQVKRPTKELKNKYETTSKLLTDTLNFGRTKLFISNFVSFKQLDKDRSLEWVKKYLTCEQQVYCFQKAVLKEQQVQDNANNKKENNK